MYDNRLFTDDHPETTLHHLGFSDPDKTNWSIQRIETYFDSRFKHQIIPGEPFQLRPKKLLETKEDALQYFKNQKMTRVLGLLNRAKSIVKRTKDKDKYNNIKQSIHILQHWVNQHKKGGHSIPDCCLHNDKDTKCVRKSDQKVFALPRRFKKKSCKNPKGFSMRSSCAPYKNCYELNN